MTTEDRLDDMLDHALEMTFPASDPISIQVPALEVPEGREPDDEKLPESIVAVH